MQDIPVLLRFGLYLGTGRFPSTSIAVFFQLRFLPPSLLLCRGNPYINGGQFLLLHRLLPALRFTLFCLRRSDKNRTGSPHIVVVAVKQRELQQ